MCTGLYFAYTMQVTKGNSLHHKTARELGVSKESESMNPS